MHKKPNFILYITDQHRADFLGCYGHRILQTPNIDRLAARGLTFDKFYVSSPVCMPNRASLMCCRVPTNHGVRMNGIPLSKTNVTFVDVLREAGYKTALIGKSHLQTFTMSKPLQSIPEAGSGYFQAAGSLREAIRHDLTGEDYNVEQADFWSVPEAKVPTPYYGFDHVELVTGHGDRVGGDYTEWLSKSTANPAELFGAENQLAHDYICPQAVRTAIPEDLYSTSYIAERAGAWLAEQQQSDQPFFLMVSWPDPHHPFNPPGRYWDMYNPEDMPIPEAFMRNDWLPPPHVAGVIGSRNSGKANLTGMNTIGCSAREAQEAQALTCGMVTMIDDCIGAIQSSLEDVQQRAATVEIFTTDHGDHLGDHRLLFKGPEQYEQITRVPFIWADPDGHKGVRTKKIGQTHDIGTTILERASIEAPWGMQGVDLVSSPGRNAAFIQYIHQKPMDGLGIRPNVRTVRDDRYRMSVFEGIKWGELYDLEADPGEFENLWGDANVLGVKLRLMEQLARLEIEHMEIVPMPIARA